ncbi:MAG TPA: Crp/Fnr family transcriptional regulator [Steroidobacteraceae bacterium]|nr:Crp/Fnr family transcriptional regulator [Steroidobacteraceae bacterium]
MDHTEASPRDEPHSPQHNRLLAGLPPKDLRRFKSNLHLVPLKLGDVLYESGALIRHAYFPISSIVSILYVMANGASAEIAVVGNEGVVGVSLFMGGGSTPSRAVVQNAGYAYRLTGASLKEEFDRAGILQQLLLRYAQALITQMTQTAACNRHHPVDRQLCRWLLLSSDGLPFDELVMTQDLIAKMLGVERKGVKEAAGKLQRAGLIDYKNGTITVLDREGLKARTCECYGVVRTEYDRLLPGHIIRHAVKKQTVATRTKPRLLRSG